MITKENIILYCIWRTQKACELSNANYAISKLLLLIYCRYVTSTPIFIKTNCEQHYWSLLFLGSSATEEMWEKIGDTVIRSSHPGAKK